jgi:hypothetical protein
MEPIITNDDEKKVYPNIEENEYRSCCFRCDKELVKYLTAISISYIILGLSIYKLIIINGSNEDKSIYISLITLILGIQTNGPIVKNKKSLTPVIEDIE